MVPFGLFVCWSSSYFIEIIIYFATKTDAQFESHVFYGSYQLLRNNFSSMGAKL